VEIEADVSVGKLRDKMMAVNLIMARKSKPRVMLVLKDAVAEAVMAKYLIQHNFKLVDDKISNKTESLNACRTPRKQRPSGVWRSTMAPR